MDVDVAVLGGGPGGYPAAIRAAQLGLSVVVIEQGNLGGCCLNVGCIPTKAWVQSAHAMKDATQTFAQLGVSVSGAALDFGQVQKNKDTIVKALVSGVGGLLKANGVAVVAGKGRFTTPNTILVEGGEEVRFKHAIIATGSHPAAPPVEGIESAKCVDSTGLLAVSDVPKRLIVLGGGVIGCEFASIFHHFGSQVTIVEFMPHLIPTEDADAIKTLEKSFKTAGIAMQLGAKATRIEETKTGVVLHFEGADGVGFVEGDLVLVSTGRLPNVADLGLDDIGIAYDEKRGIRTDATRRTGQPHIYAVGDVAGYWQLAHTAFKEGEVAAENIAGHHVEMSGHVPRCIYTDPEVAAVGLTEAQARETYGDSVVVGSFPFAAIARAAMYADKTGFVKTIHAGPYDELVGVVVVGINATEIINAGVIALDAEATIETVADSIAAHPTLAEGFKEAGLVALGRPIHLPPVKKRTEGAKT